MSEQEHKKTIFVKVRNGNIVEVRLPPNATHLKQFWISCDCDGTLPPYCDIYKTIYEEIKRTTEFIGWARR